MFIHSSRPPLILAMVEGISEFIFVCLLKVIARLPAEFLHVQFVLGGLGKERKMIAKDLFGELASRLVARAHALRARRIVVYDVGERHLDQTLQVLFEFLLSFDLKRVGFVERATWWKFGFFHVWILFQRLLVFLSNLTVTPLLTQEID